MTYNKGMELLRKLDVEFLQNIDWTQKDIDVDSIYEDKSVYEHFVYLYSQYVKEHHSEYINYFYYVAFISRICSLMLGRVTIWNGKSL